MFLPLAIPPIADIHVDFVSSFYSTNESAGGIDVCVSVVRGQLGTNITLELNTLKGTAKGKFKSITQSVYSINSSSHNSLYNCIRFYCTV